jgi:hypothetical protein
MRRKDRALRERIPFLRRPEAIYGYYADLTACRYCEIEASGEIINGDGKCVCSKITIVREIPLQEFLALVNEGSTGNTGWANEGDSNKGDCNKGDCNEGDGNEGDWQQGQTKGDSNKGDWNKGDSNEGDSQRGQRNKGDWNKGDWNKGDWNKGDWNEGDSNKGRLEQTRTRERGRLEQGRLQHRFIQSRRWSVRNLQHGRRLRNLQQIHADEAHRNREDGRIPIFGIVRAMRREPTEDELAEIRKLPNFDEKVMNELIFGKGDKK